MPRSQEDRTKLRIRLLLGVMLAVHAGILTHLWNLQVVQGHVYQDQLSRNSLRWIRLPGQRGQIVDRNGIVLADNRPSTCIALYPEELRLPGNYSKTIDRIEEIVDELALKLQLERKISRKEIVDHYRVQRLLPLILWEELDQVAIARWAEQVGVMQGVDLITKTVRVYPYNDLLCHTIGYVGRGGMGGEGEQDYDFYLPEMEGKSGLEKEFDSRLRGRAGGERVRIDVSLYKHGTEAQVAPEKGTDIQLTIDARIQHLCEQVLQDKTGSMVVMDPRNGEVLAMASNPRFDLNAMVPFISNKVWNELNGDKRKPLLNRPVQEHYSPGSTVKPATALSALLAGKAKSSTVHHCAGSYQIAPGARPMYCNNRHGHGPLNMRQALERSCNVYFWRLAEQTGYAPIYSLLEHTGFGKRTGIEVDYEVPGLLPTDAWKRTHHRDRLRGGDIANISIGQGYLNATPLQMAVFTSALANGGTIHPPTLIGAFRDSEEAVFHPSDLRKASWDLGWNKQKTEVIRQGMRDVVMSDTYGTARRAQVGGLSYGGKTGTAQYGLRGNRKYRSWMIAFAPYENPTIAAVVLIDSGGGSGVDAVPRMKLLMQALFPEHQEGGADEATRS